MLPAEQGNHRQLEQEDVTVESSLLLVDAAPEGPFALRCHRAPIVLSFFLPFGGCFGVAA